MNLMLSSHPEIACTSWITNKVLEYHIAKRADITVVCTDVHGDDATRFGCVKMNEDCRIEEFDEKPMVAQSNTISTGIYVYSQKTAH